MATFTTSRQFADKSYLRACQRKLEGVSHQISDLSNVLELASNETRLKILYLLQEEGELCPCDISDIIGITIQAISQHLRKLKDGELIYCRREGQTLFYIIDPLHLKVIRPFFKYITQYD